jgi:hypothetical protein
LGVPARSENEWYKAAYHDPVNAVADAGGTPDYWLYPTQSDSAPTVSAANVTGDISNPGTNVANYNFRHPDPRIAVA